MERRLEWGASPTSEVHLTGIEFEGGAADVGGAVVVYWPASLKVHDCTFSSNEAAGDGGAIYVYPAGVRLGSDEARFG